jgi:hypothetical protein
MARDAVNNVLTTQGESLATGRSRPPAAEASREEVGPLNRNAAREPRTMRGSSCFAPTKRLVSTDAFPVLPRRLGYRVPLARK